MNREFYDYIDRIIYRIGISGKKERQIREDLLAALIEKQQATGENNPYILIGDPEEIAADFRENLGIKNSGRYNYRMGYGFEYISKTKIFGLPLVHVNGKPFGIAKGIFSFGGIAVGVFSFGGLSLGIVSFGGVTLGLLAALGGIAVSGLLSLGGIAISYLLSFGGLSVAKYIAFGGYARADIAIGGVAKGIVAVFSQHGTGQFTFKAPVNVDEVINAINQVKPGISKGLINMIKLLISNA